MFYVIIYQFYQLIQFLNEFCEFIIFFNDYINKFNNINFYEYYYKIKDYNKYLKNMPIRIIFKQNKLFSNCSKKLTFLK